MTSSLRLKLSLQTVHSFPPSTRDLSALNRGSESMVCVDAGGGAVDPCPCSIS